MNKKVIDLFGSVNQDHSGPNFLWHLCDWNIFGYHLLNAYHGSGIRLSRELRSMRLLALLRNREGPGGKIAHPWSHLQLVSGRQGNSGQICIAPGPCALNHCTSLGGWCAFIMTQFPTFLYPQNFIHAIVIYKVALCKFLLNLWINSENTYLTYEETGS